MNLLRIYRGGLVFFRKPKGFKYVLHLGKYLSYLPCFTNEQRQHFYFNKLAKRFFCSILDKS